MNLELSDAERRLIEAILAGEKAWSKIADLVRGGHSLETIADLMLREILEKWDHPDDGEAVTLATWGAYVWPIVKQETLELAERPCTVHRQKKVQGEIVNVRESERVNFWVEGAKPDKRRTKRHVEDYGLMAEMVPDPRAPSFLVDEVSGEEIELFKGLFNGAKVQGIKIKICPKLKGSKGAKGKGAKGKTQPKRRKAG